MRLLQRSSGFFIAGFAALTVLIAPALNAQKGNTSPGTLKISRDEIQVNLPTGQNARITNSVSRSQAGIETVLQRRGADTFLITRDSRSAYGYAQVDGNTYPITTKQGRIEVLSPDATSAVELRVAAARADDAIVDPATVEEFRGKLRASRSLANTSVAMDQVRSVVDVAFFYDDTVLDIAGNQDPHTRVQAAMDYMNAAYALHGVPLEIRAVYVGPFPGRTFSFSPLDDLVANAQANEIADSFGADLLHALFLNTGQQYCGIGFLAGRYAASAYDCDLNHVIAHEIGHNFGMNHDRANAGNSGIPELEGFNYGYVCGGRGTIMSYPGSPHLPHYSSPTLFNGGVACGIPEGQPLAAHNARVLELTRQTVEGRRPTRATNGTIRFETPAKLTLSEEDGAVIAVEVTRDGDLSKSVSIDVAAIDGSATEGVDFEDVATRLVFEANENRKTVTLKAIDDEDFDPNETFQLVLRYPLGATVANDTLQFKITDREVDHGKAQFESSALAFYEASGTLTLNVKRTGDVTNGLTIGYESYPITASANVDYQSVSGQLEFLPGETLKTVQVRLIDDSLFQGYMAYRVFGLRLLGVNTAAPSSMSIYIYNDDNKSGRGVLAKDQYEVSETDGQAVLRVTRTDGAEGALNISYKTIGNTAQPGKDYGEIAGTIRLENGQVTGVILVPIFDNNLCDGDRTFRVAVTEQSQIKSEALVHIISEDPDRGRARFAASSLNVRESDGNAILEIIREGVHDGTLSLLFATTPITAIAGGDYKSQTGRIDFAPGESSKTIQIPITSDAVREAAESFRVTLYGDVTDPSAVTIEIGADASSAAVRAQTPGSTATPEVARRGGGHLDWIVLLVLLALGIRRRHFAAVTPTV